ncbi:MAG: S8 family serine peptidase, partial [Bacteroidota bacterium]
MPDHITVEDYQPRTVILKLRSEHRTLAAGNAIAHPGLQQMLATYGVEQFGRKFPRHSAPAASKQGVRDQRVDLSLIYEWHFRVPVSMEKVLRQLQALDVLAYAEPKYISRTTFVPNDPRLSEQWHLNVIRAFAGWDISTGSAGVTIAIIDTGIDLAHPDLTGKIRQNLQDPINGVDDDGDGFVDNFFGWNLVDNTNDPSITESYHGVHVAGCAAPETNNERGVAGPGYNSLLLPVKVGNDLTVTQGYEGIVYAADHGADIINCSWGGSGPGEFGQDVVNYATFNRNALVVAAMGNNGTDRLFFPASYDNVLAVTATRESDEKAGFANYNFTCDVAAPGQGILSTFENGGYDLLSGTSMATPITAGCAALVKAQYPSLNALQIGEQLRVTTDNIDAVGGNTAFAGKLGTGRINLERALSGINSPSVVLSDEQITDSGNGIFESGDELEVSALFTNYLATTGPLTVTLSSTSPLVNVIAGTISLPGLGMLEAADNSNQPFRLEVLSTEDINQTVFLRVDITDGTYSSTE